MCRVDQHVGLGGFSSEASEEGCVLEEKEKLVDEEPERLLVPSLPANVGYQYI